MFLKGQSVQQIIPAPIIGIVESFAVDQEIGELQIKVVWTDADEVEHHRYFKESELMAD